MILVALKKALETLGYSVYHMSEALKNTPKKHLVFWEEALQAKLEGKGTPFGKAEFDKFLGDYNVTTVPQRCNRDTDF